MSKKGPPIEFFDFGPLGIQISMLSNHRDYRIWSAWFGKGRTTQKFWASFKLEKGFWFGPMAYYMIARGIVADLELVLRDLRLMERERGYPEVQQPEMYRERLDALGRTFDIYDEEPLIWKATQAADRWIEGHWTSDAALHNARAAILERQIPDKIRLGVVPGSGLNAEMEWGKSDEKPIILRSFNYGKTWNVDATITFFRMIGLYMSEVEFRNVRFLESPYGPKEWSPYKRMTELQRGKDYGVEDFQPGEHDL